MTDAADAQVGESFCLVDDDGYTQATDLVYMTSPQHMGRIKSYGGQTASVPQPHQLLISFPRWAIHSPSPT
jgi:hypothetical protein